jgi:hypothetical protein
MSWVINKPRIITFSTRSTIIPFIFIGGEKGSLRWKLVMFRLLVLRYITNHFLVLLCYLQRSYTGYKRSDHHEYISQFDQRAIQCSLAGCLLSPGLRSSDAHATTSVPQIPQPPVADVAVLSQEPVHSGEASVVWVVMQTSAECVRHPMESGGMPPRKIFEI